MTELSPIPAGHNADKRWLGMFTRKDPDLAKKISQRRGTLKDLFKKSAPRRVICYGHKKAEDFADLLGIKWEPINEKVLQSADSKCLLLPFFGQSQMSRSIVDKLLEDKLLS
jgi:hypothetical protein